MKNFIILFLFAGLVMLYSCGENTSETTDNNEVVENSETTDNSDVVEKTSDNKTGDAKNCDEFLDEYEVWIDSYIEIMAKYLKNPMDAALAEEYMEIVQDAATWSTQWLKMMSCASDEKYQKRFDEIAEKADKKMEELAVSDTKATN